MGDDQPPAASRVDPWAEVRRKNWRAVVGLVLLPIGCLSVPWTLPLLVLGVMFIAASQRVMCPRCGRPYARAGFFHGFTQRCLSCGAEVGSPL